MGPCLFDGLVNLMLFIVPKEHQDLDEFPGATPPLMSALEPFMIVSVGIRQPANLGVYWSLMEPGDTFMGLDLYQGGD